jgi:DNA topoisomerase-1
MSRSPRILPFPTDPLKSASVAGLRYIRAEGPGITRIKGGKDFRYVGPDGKEITDESELKRIRSLVIPPAWTDVWICPSPSGHLQAVGRDAKGRKQYRYHPEYRKVRDLTKFGRLLVFGAALKKIRKWVDDDLNLRGLPKRKVLATAVRLLEKTCMRIGNEEYAKENASYGLTTLHDEHVDISGGKIRFHFRGKSGQFQNIELNDPRLANIVKKCREIPGYELFQYIDHNGNHCRIDSTDVNEYLRQITGEEFTAKDFRTWGGTGLAAMAFEQLGKAENGTQLKKNIVAAIKMVAGRLGNRPATCRKYYVHPAIIDAYVDGSLLEVLASIRSEPREEHCVMRIVTQYVEKLTIPSRASEHLTRQLKQSIRRRA